MVVGAFPLFKLGFIALRQIARPLANLLKRRAKSSPFFRNYICIPPAQRMLFTIFELTYFVKNI